MYKGWCWPISRPSECFLCSAIHKMFSKCFHNVYTMQQKGSFSCNLLPGAYSMFAAYNLSYLQFHLGGYWLWLLLASLVKNQSHLVRFCNAPAILKCPSPALAFRAPRKLSPHQNSVIWINGNRSSCGKLLKCFLRISGFFNIHGWWSTWHAPFLWCFR